MKERLKKIYALAMQGVDGEKEQAAAMLEKLIKKYGVSIEKIDEERTEKFEMEFHGEIEKILLSQTVFKVTGSSNNCHRMRYVSSGRLCQTRACVHCTKGQKIEIELLFDFYKRLFEKEKEYLLQAFIQKHNIFGNEKSGTNNIPTDEELKKIFSMMNCLSDETPFKQIEAAQQG